jgi:hypothetical protein
MQISKSELVEASYHITGGNLESLSLDQIWRLMTITQYVTDLCINEIEDRGELTFFHGSPIIPYQSEHVVQTILTRDE